MYKIAVLGDRDSVLGFRALGLDVFFADDAETARKTLHRLAQESYAVIYVTEQLAQSMAAEIARYQNDIPGKSGALGLADRALHAAVERAVGADIS